MEQVVLKATKRDVVGKKAGAPRRSGKLPAVLYGHRIQTTPILLDAYEGSQTLSHLTLVQPGDDRPGREAVLGAGAKEAERFYLELPSACRLPDRIAH